MDEKDISQNFNAFPLTALDKHILSMKDEDYQPIQWSELSHVICIFFLL